MIQQLEDRAEYKARGDKESITINSSTGRLQSAAVLRPDRPALPGYTHRSQLVSVPDARASTCVEDGAVAVQQIKTLPLEHMARDEQSGPGPEGIARLFYRILQKANPRLRYTTGPFPQWAAAMMKRLLPYAVIELRHEILLRGSPSIALVLPGLKTLNNSSCA
jgi:hypothetical protein